MDEATLPLRVKERREELRALLRPLLQDMPDAEFMTLLDRMTVTMLKEHDRRMIRRDATLMPERLRRHQ